MSFLSRFLPSRSVVGLDIGSSAIKLVELRESKGEIYLQRLGIEPLSLEAIVDGSIMDSSLVVDAIHRLNDQTKVKGTSYATSLSGQSVIIKKIQLPAMAEEELADSIQWEAEQYIPFDINDVRLDYVVLSEGEPGRDNMEVLLVAIKRDKVNDYVSVISQTGKIPIIVDVDVFAIQRTYELNYDIDPRKTVALINVGATFTNVNILARGQTVFWRDISLGGNQFTEALQREFNLSFTQAETLKQGETVDHYSPVAVQPVLDAVSAEMASEIRKTFDFFSATSSEGPVDELVISGGCALTPNLLPVLRERFQVPTELMNPLRRIHYKESDFDGEWLRSIAPMLAVAVGLSLRRADRDADLPLRRRSAAPWSDTPKAVSVSPQDLIPEPSKPVEDKATALPRTKTPAYERPVRPSRFAAPLGYAEEPGPHSAASEDIKPKKDVPAAPPPIDHSNRGSAAVIAHQYEFDVFICHASEDKNFVEPLVRKLKERGLNVWYDSLILKWGDRLRPNIDQGLSRSRFGVVVLSPNFCRKDWPKRELEGLLAQEREDRKVILPLWHDVTKEDVTRFSPLLADRVALTSQTPLEDIVTKVLDLLEN